MSFNLYKETAWKKKFQSEKHGYKIVFMKLKLINLILSCIEMTASYVMHVCRGSEIEKKIVVDYWTLTYRKSYLNCWTRLGTTRFDSFVFWKSSSFSCTTLCVCARHHICVCTISQVTWKTKKTVSHTTPCMHSHMILVASPCAIKHATSESIFNFIPIH